VVRHNPTVNLLRLSATRAVMLVAATLVPWVAFVGWLGPRLSDPVLLRAHPVRAPGRYERWLRISRWKDRLPEGGSVFGGTSKRSIAVPEAATRNERLHRFALESRRAELVHLAALAPVPILAAVIPRPVAIGTVVGAFAANLPCIAVTRFNRGRIERTLARRSTPRIG
jgi:glycosyl-4,4'-diaponeurosporenoate acyltransferase